MIADAIRTLLINAATAAGSRIAVDLLPEQTNFPCVRITQLSASALLDMQGPAGMRQFSFQLSAFATSGAAARSLIEQCRTALNMYRGTVSGNVIQVIYPRSEPLVSYEQDAKVYMAMMDFEAAFSG